MSAKTLTPQQTEIINEDIQTANEMIAQLKEIWNEKAQLSTLGELRHWQKERRVLIDLLAGIQPDIQDTEITSAISDLSDWFPPPDSKINHAQTKDENIHEHAYKYANQDNRFYSNTNIKNEAMQKIKPPPKQYRNIYIRNKDGVEVEKTNSNIREQPQINSNTIKTPP